MNRVKQLAIPALILFSTGLAHGQPLPFQTQKPGHDRHAGRRHRSAQPRLGLGPSAFLPMAGTGTIQVDITPSHATNRFNPRRAMGAGVDAVPAGSVQRIYTPENIAKMLAAGHGSLTYRLYTELSVQDWHWNPVGTWSDPRGHGYFTGSVSSLGKILLSSGYRLPHRGFTFDQGNDDDYSRLTDGDPTTYWKSNPYLDRHFTGEDNALHPQWIVVDLGTKNPVNAVELLWANPYASAYRVQYWTGPDAIQDPANGQWITFPSGTVTRGTGGDVILPLAPRPMDVQFVRVLMTASSSTCDTHGPADIRNCLGYAMAEIGVGTLASDGTFTDLVNHTPDNSQTATYVSSVDPWHEPANQVTDEEQPGLDLVFTCGLTRGLPAMVPVGMLYGTPGDAAAEIRYLKQRGYPLSSVELGEEPDGQYILPEDYAALYLQWAKALHAVDPLLKLGGPVFAADSGVQTWPDATGNTDWLNRFVRYLTVHGRMADLSFLSVEHYPFAPCQEDWSLLLQEPALVDQIFHGVSAAGLPSGFPLFITEYNFSSGYTPAPQETLGALWQADFLGRFFTLGGRGAFYYEYEPLPLFASGNCWGSFSMFTASDSNQIKAPTAQFFSAQLINLEWAQPVDADHSVYPAVSDVTDVSGNVLVTAYALRRPDGQWALLLVNNDPIHPHPVKVIFRDTTDHSFKGPVAMVTFGVDNYVWHPNGPNGYPNPDGPAFRTMVAGGAGTVYTLPRGSLTVLRGSVSP